MTEDQIKHMANRFLGWKLPDNFNPDGGITFDKVANLGTEHQYYREPIGTNLLTYIQAEPMVRHMLEGLPQPTQIEETGWLIEHEDEPKWLTLKPGEASYEVCWTTDSAEALRFARRDDADDYASTFMDEAPVRITEHLWTGEPK